MPDRAVRALLDNNAWIDILARDPSRNMLTALQQAVARGNVDILVPLAAIEETMAYAPVDGTEARRRLAYMCAFSHGRILREPGELAHMEVRGEPTERCTFIPSDEAASLYAMALEAADNHGVFTALNDGKIYHASSMTTDTKNRARDSGRSSDMRTEAEIVSAWTARHSGTASEGPVLTDGLELASDATPDEVLLAYGNRMTRQADRIFEAWVQSVLVKAGAAAGVSASDPASHPFFSASVAYEYAHLGRHLRDHTLVARNDEYDRHYCVLSVAADVLVTSDAALQRTCRLMPFRPFDVCSPLEFTETLH